MGKSSPGDDRVIRVALCQRNLVVGDIDGNVDKIRDSLGRVREQGADLALFPELTITGYPPEDLLLKPQAIRPRIFSSSRTLPSGRRPRLGTSPPRCRTWWP
jgi:hypothetical protein